MNPRVNSLFGVSLTHSFCAFHLCPYQCSHHVVVLCCSSNCNCDRRHHSCCIPTPLYSNRRPSLLLVSCCGCCCLCFADAAAYACPECTCSCCTAAAAAVNLPNTTKYSKQYVPWYLSTGTTHTLLPRLHFSRFSLPVLPNSRLSRHSAQGFGAKTFFSWR